MIIEVTRGEGRYFLSFPYDPKIINRVRRITGRRWHPDKKMWSIPFNSENQLKETFSERELIWIHPETMHEWQKFEVDPELKDLMKIQPYPYQWVGGMFLRTVGNAFLADEMGLGKTLAALVAFTKLKKDDPPKKALVLCPTSLKNQWLSEINKFTYHKGIVIDGAKNKRPDLWQEAYDPSLDFVIMNYELIQTDYDYVFDFCKAHEDDLVVILDEAQKIKNWKTKTSTMIKGGTWKSGKEEAEYERLPSSYRWLLSGTPMENKPDELYNLFNFLDPDILGSNYFVFRSQHIQLGRFNNVIGVKNRNALRQKISPYLLRRRVEDVNQDLPKVSNIRIELEMTPLQKMLHEIANDRLYDLIRYRKEDDNSDAILGGFSLLGAIANSPKLLAVSESGYAKRLLKEINPNKTQLEMSPKIDWIIDLLTSKLESNPEFKVVIFTKSTKMQEMVHNAINKEFGKSCKVYLLNGSMNATQRNDSREGFWKDGNVFISTDAGSTGVNLQCASFLVNIDLPWNPAILWQRNGRVRRLGSTHDRVFIFNLISTGSLDERVEEVIYSKTTMFEQIIENTDEEREVITRLGQNTMRKLLGK